MYCIDNGMTLQTLPMEQYKASSSLFEEDVYEKISLENCVESRNALGGPAQYNVLHQIKRVRGLIS